MVVVHVPQAQGQLKLGVLKASFFLAGHDGMMYLVSGCFDDFATPVDVEGFCALDVVRGRRMTGSRVGQVDDDGMSGIEEVEEGSYRKAEGTEHDGGRVLAVCH